MRRRSLARVALAAALVVAVSGAQGALPFSNDAGSGGDAPDDPEDAYPLPGLGRYHGNLTTPLDADWYRLDGAGGPATCLRAQVDGSVLADAVLADAPDLEVSVQRSLHPNQHVALGLAAPNPQALLLGLEPRQVDGEASGAGLGSYALNVTHTPVHTADGDPVPDDGDAPAPGAADPPAVPSACFVGTLERGPDHPASGDAYAFQGRLQEEVTLSLVTATADAPLTYLNLTDPAGETVRSITSDDPQTVTLDKRGQWSVSVETTEEVTQLQYGVTLVQDPEDDDDEDDDDEDDDGPSCRPRCSWGLMLP